MRIGPPSVTHEQDRHVLSANISIENNGVNVPESAWFATGGEESLFLPDLADAFVVGLVASAMYLGEDIWVEGTVSTRLASGIDTYQNVLSTWWPESFKLVDIHYESLVERREDLRPRGVGCTFSGGLDSYHAVLQLLPAHVKYSGFSITHALMINGFDQLYDPERQGMAQKMYDVYQPTLKEWNVDLLMIDSNMKSFRDAILPRRQQIDSFSSALAACAHALGGLFGRFGLSGHATYAYSDLKPIGSHPALDHHLSSDQLQIIYSGASHSRTEKVELLADFPHVRNSLRVCFGAIDFDQQTGMPLNCCKCEKCVRTIVALAIIGELDNFPTFSKRRYPLLAYRDPNVLCVSKDYYLKDLTELARRHGQNGWVATLDAARNRRRKLRNQNT